MMKSMMHPDTAIMTGVLLGGAVFLIYNNALPTVADLNTTPANNDAAEKARKTAAIKSAALVGLVAVVSRDLNTFIIGGAAMFGMDYLYKHANATNPGTQKLDPALAGTTTPLAPVAMVEPLPGYSTGY